MMVCAKCNTVFVQCLGEGGTEVFFMSPPGHDHDQNCVYRTYVCAQGHQTKVHLRQHCPVEGCDWRAPETCFCHPDVKLDAWPELWVQV